MKKTVCISGSLLFPPEEGKRAIIRHRGGYIYTSCVVEILEQRKRYVRFETMNSIYNVLSPAPASVQRAVKLKMCA